MITNLLLLFTLTASPAAALLAPAPPEMVEADEQRQDMSRHTVTVGVSCRQSKKPAGRRLMPSQRAAPRVTARGPPGSVLTFTRDDGSCRFLRVEVW